MHKVKRIKLACLAAFVILPAQAYALGVGKLTMHSALDEPLNASIELTVATETELESLEVSLGSVGVFNMAGIDRNEQLKSISFELAEENGRNVIRMTTDQPFRDPFLHFIINAKWANGSMLREYTALLDPPSYLSGAAANIQAPTVTAPVAVATPADTKYSAAPSSRRTAMAAESTPASTKYSAAQSSRRAAMAEKPTPASTKYTAASSSRRAAMVAKSPAPMPAANISYEKLGPDVGGEADSSDYASFDAGSAYGPIKKGETLWEIADHLRAGTQFGAAQVLMAIFEQNPTAFLENNINLILAGKTLQVPSEDEITSRSNAVAMQEVRAQMNQWQAYKESHPAGTDTASAEKELAVEVVSEEIITSESGRQEMVEEDVLQIVRARVDTADTSGSGVSEKERTGFKNEVSAYKENIGLLEESLESAQLEKDELSTRVALLEQQIAKANKIIELQNTDLALLQDKSENEKAVEETLKQADEAKQAALETAILAEAESAKSAAADISPIAPAPVTAEIKKEPELKKAPEVKKAAEVKKPKAVKAPAEKKAAKKPAKTRVKAKPAEQKSMLASFMDSVTSNWMTMVGAVLAVLLVLVGLFVVLRRRRSIAEFEDSIISGTAVLDISTAESTEPLDSSSEASFLSDFVPGMGNMQADEVDPLAEAEVYMAYGRDEQAEEVLKDAAAKNPDRHELKLKLLEIYQGRKDVGPFETLAEELYPADGKIPMEVWAKVAEMGKIVNPDNPLFQGEMNVHDESLFGDKDRNDGQLGDLLDTPSDTTEEVELMETLNEGLVEGDTEEVTEEVTEDLTEDLTEEVLAATADLSIEDNTEGLQLTEELNLDTLAMEMTEFEPDSEASEDVDDINEGDIDFNLEGIDLDLGGVEEDETEEPAIAATLDMSDLEGIGDLSLDMDTDDISADLNLDSLEAPSLQDETLEFADLDDLSLPDLDSDTKADAAEVADDSSLSGLPDGANDTWDEAGTKLDLARAYIEMDDNESAQSILEEVVKEGSDEQKNESRDLMKKINAG